MSQAKRKIFYIPAIAASIAIFIASHQEKVEFIETDILLGDKILHFAAYFIYGIALLVGLMANFSGKKKIFALLVIIGALFAISDEAHQSYVPGRDADIWDWVADITGIIASYSLARPIGSLLNKWFNIPIGKWKNSSN